MPACRQLNKVQSAIFEYMQTNPAYIPNAVINSLNINQNILMQHLDEMKVFDFYFTDFSGYVVKVIHIALPLIISYTFTDNGLVIDFNDDNITLINEYWSAT